MKNLFLSAMVLVGVCATAQEAKKTTKEQVKTESTTATPEVKKSETATTTVKTADNGTAKTATKTETTTTVPADQAAQKPKSEATKSEK